MAQRQIISHIPQKGMTGEQWGIVIQTELVKIWVESLTPAEMQAYIRACPNDRLDLQLVPANLFEKLDGIILEQAETLGWRITLSELVQYRFSAWDHDPDGPEKARKFGLAWRNSALIQQGRKLPPIEDPDQWAVKKQTVEELRLVLHAMRANFATRRRTPSHEEVRKIFAEIVSSAPNYAHLRANLDRWTKFFEQESVVQEILHQSSRPTPPSPASVYDQFLSWSSGWETESLRQAISKLRPKL